MAASSSTTLTRSEEKEPLQTGEEVEIIRSTGQWSMGTVISIDKDGVAVEIIEGDGTTSRKRVAHSKIGSFIRRDGDTDNRSISGQTMAASENFESQDGQTMAILKSKERRLMAELANAKDNMKLLAEK